MLKNLHWLGHSSFRWDGAKIIYFDPWNIPDGSKESDIILISHEHYDHFSKNDIAKISGPGTVFVCNKAVASELEDAGIAAKNIRELSASRTAEINGVKIRAVASYNIGKPYHPKEAGKLGFIVTMGGISVYHAGDTDKIPEMKDVSCDIALLPVSGTYVMTVKEAAEAAMVLKPKVAVPMHYGSIVGHAKDGEEFKRLLEGKVDVGLLKKEDM